MAHLPCLSIYIPQYIVKRVGAIIFDVLECLDVALIHIKVRVCREFGDHLSPIAPLMDGSIELVNSISIVFNPELEFTYRCCHQRNHGHRYHTRHTPIIGLKSREQTLKMLCKRGRSSSKVQILDCRDNSVIPIWPRAPHKRDVALKEF